MRGVREAGEGVGEGAAPRMPAKGVRVGVGVGLPVTVGLKSPALNTLLATVLCTRKVALSRGMPRPCAPRFCAREGLTKDHRSSVSAVASTGFTTMACTSAVAAMAWEVVRGRGGKKAVAALGRLPLACSLAKSEPCHVSPAVRPTPTAVSCAAGTARGPGRLPRAVRPVAPRLRRKAYPASSLCRERNMLALGVEVGLGVCEGVRVGEGVGVAVRVAVAVALLVPVAAAEGLSWPKEELALGLEVALPRAEAVRLALLVEEALGSCVWLEVLEAVEVAVALAWEGLVVAESVTLPVARALPLPLALSVAVRVRVWLAVPVSVKLPQAEGERE
jgi:hypothetical protein